MSEFTFNLSSQVQQKADLKSAFVSSLAGIVYSPLFSATEINDLYHKTLQDLQNELQKKSNKCGEILSSVDLDSTAGGVSFLQESDFPQSTYMDDLINLSWLWHLGNWSRPLDGFPFLFYISFVIERDHSSIHG